MKLDCEFHARLSAQRELHRPANWFTPSSNAVTLMQSKPFTTSKDIYLERLHYQVSTNLGLLQANLTYMHAKLGTSYHWLPELYRHMKLSVFEGMVEALEKHNAWRKRELELAKTTPKKKRRIELKKKRVVKGIKRIKCAKHGHDTYFGGSGGSDFEEMVCNSGDGVNQDKEKGKGSGCGKGKPLGKGKCAACTHRHSSHRDCPLHKSHAKK